MRVAHHFDGLSEEAESPADLRADAEELLYYAREYKISVPGSIQTAMYGYPSKRGGRARVPLTALRTWCVRMRRKFGGQNHAIVTQIVQHLANNDGINDNRRSVRRPLPQDDAVWQLNWSLADDTFAE